MTDYTDLKRRLAEIHGGETTLTPRIFATIHQSAAAIAALEAEVARLRSELQSATAPHTDRITMGRAALHGRMRVLEAEHATMRAAIIDRLHSEECDCNACADLRAALADQPTKG